VDVILQKLGFVGLPGSSGLTLVLIAMALTTSFILGYWLSYVYRKTHTGFSYESSFNFTLIIITVVITIIMMVIGSNIALSLGLIGSLSIIRFRAVIKDTKDMAYLFWAIATGLSVGSGNYLMAFLSVAFISVLVTGLSRIDFERATHKDYIMVVQRTLDQNDSEGNNNMVPGMLDQHNVQWSIRSSLVDQNNLFSETTYSISFHKTPALSQSNWVHEIGGLENIKKVTMLSPETNLFA
jgi:uncharacterized membrane protein YhiD involved in acid resistance